MSIQTFLCVLSITLSVVSIVTIFVKIVRWIDRQKRQDEELQSIKDEQRVTTIGLLAALKGLAEQGCDGPVHDAITEIENFLIIKAHK